MSGYINYSFIFLSFAFPNFYAYLLEDSLHANLKISNYQTGFHRILCYDVEILDFSGNSDILIKHVLPEDLYVDPYEVLHRKEIIIKELIDCEVPAYLAKPLEIELCSIFTNYVHHICIPVHIRYQVPHRCRVYGETKFIKMNIPFVFLQRKNNFSNEVTDVCLNIETNTWMPLTTSKVQLPNLEIPVGCTEYFYLKLFLLIAAIISSTFYMLQNLLKVSINCKEI